MKGLSDAYLFRKDEKVGRNFRDNIKKIDWQNDVISPDYFRNETDIMKRRYAFTLKPAVLNAFENKEIVVIYPNQFARLTELVPIFLVKKRLIDPSSNQNDIVAVLNLEAIGASKSKNNEEIKIDIKKLYGFLECAYITKQLNLNERLFTSNIKIKRLSTNCYIKLLRKVLDKLYAINMIPETADRISYLLGKFFLLYVLEQPDSEFISDIAYACTSQNIPRKTIQTMDIEFGKEAFMNLEAFMKSLSNYFDILRNLNLGVFLREIMTLYGQDSAFIIENYPRLIEVVYSSCVFNVRGFRDQLVDSVINKDALDLNTEINKALIRG